jgi:hypothetical protein
MRRLLPDHSPQSLAIAGELGGADWPCPTDASARPPRLAEQGQFVITATWSMVCRRRGGDATSARRGAGSVARSVDGGILAAARALVEMLDAVSRHD